MIYLYSFLFVGILCLIGEIILDNTNLTPGHITSLFVSLGAILSFFNIYPWFVEKVSVGASIPITSFGNLLYQACLEGFHTKGILGMFTNLLTTTSACSGGAVICACLVALCLKSREWLKIGEGFRLF